jgi:hypothetical protein
LELRGIAGVEKKIACDGVRNLEKIGEIHLEYHSIIELYAEHYQSKTRVLDEAFFLYVVNGNKLKDPNIYLNI